MGSLVVRDRKELEANSNLYDYDLPEHVIIVNDWAHTITSEWIGQYLHSDGWNLVKSLLINGMGVDSSHLANTPIAQFKVKQFGRYRFRLIDVGAYSCTMKFSIDQHNLTIISADGKAIEPVQVESIVINPGERYDFVVDARMNAAKYFVKVAGVGHVCRMSKLFQVAELSYENSTNELDLSSVNYTAANRPGKVI